MWIKHRNEIAVFYIFFKNTFQMAVSSQLQTEQEQRIASLFTQCKYIASLWFLSSTRISAVLTSFTSKNDMLTHVFINSDFSDLWETTFKSNPWLIYSFQAAQYTHLKLKH